MNHNPVKRSDDMEKDRPLRIGVLTGTKDALENWQLAILDRIKGDQRFVLETVIVHDRPEGEAKASRLFRLQWQIENRLLARQPRYLPGTFQAQDQRFDVMHAMADDAARGNYVARLASELGLDLIVRMTPASLPASVADVLPLGIWSFNFLDECSADGSWFGYRDLLTKAPATELVLSAERGAAGKATIAACSFNIKISAARNTAFIKERAVTLLMRELRKAAAGELAMVPGRVRAAAPPPKLSTVMHYGTALGLHLFERAAAAVGRRTHLRAAVWTLYTGRGKIDDFDPSQSIEVPPTKDDIKADPFLFEHEGDCYLFYESYSTGGHKAHISVGRFEGDRLVHVGIALSCEHHLSYPYVFRDGDDIFMMPETHATKRIEIWRCVEFPLKWELHSTALEGRSAADNMLVRHGGKWWLFSNLSDYHAYEDHCSELYIYEVDGPDLKGLKPHRHNPVVLGSVAARNGGRMFERDGHLYRPSQRNTNGIYGYGLNIMEIDELSSEAYRERCVRVITPDFKTGLHGCHHFDEAGGRYILDARLTA